MHARTIIGLSLLALLAGRAARAQFSPPTDTTGGKRGTYHIVVTVGVGSSQYASAIGIPPAWRQTETNRLGQSVMIRALWHPDHRFRTGLETGLTTFYTYKGVVNGEPGSVSVSAIPILLVYQMPLAWHSGTERSLWRRLAATVGFGTYLIRSEYSYKGSVNSQELSAGWLWALSYTQPLSNRLRLAAEVRWLNPTATRENAASLQAQLLWRVLSW
ncbi:hypothetical protein [Fibrella aestuarina]|nr:hypothetical protein [Fibrella aestuarina]